MSRAPRATIHNLCRNDRRRFPDFLRMSVASELLRGTRRSIADIAAEIGYESKAAFGKTFKAKNGLTPAKFRQRSSARNLLKNRQNCPRDGYFLAGIAVIFIQKLPL